MFLFPTVTGEWLAASGGGFRSEIASAFGQVLTVFVGTGWIGLFSRCYLYFAGMEGKGNMWPACLRPQGFQIQRHRR
jgi:hypothetical protein